MGAADGESEIFAPGLLSGQVALVTGGGTGLGKASALELDVVEDEQETTLAWRAPCTPVRSMLTAP